MKIREGNSRIESSPAETTWHCNYKSCNERGMIHVKTFCTSKNFTECPYYDKIKINKLGVQQ